MIYTGASILSASDKNILKCIIKKAKNFIVRSIRIYIYPHIGTSEFCLVLNQSEKSNYNTNLDCIKQIQKLVINL